MILRCFAFAGFQAFVLAVYQSSVYGMLPENHFFLCLHEFVCVEVLRPSQPNGVMSSAVSLPNHTFTGQA